MSMKLFISQPMYHREEFEVLKTRDRIYEAMKTVRDVELIDTYHREDAPEGVGRLWYLGRSIQDLGKADLVIFAPGWSEAKGCVAEHDICEIYHIPYINWSEATEGLIHVLQNDDNEAVDDGK